MSRPIDMDEALHYTPEQFNLYILMSLNNVIAAIAELDRKIAEMCDKDSREKEEIAKATVALTERMRVLESGERFRRAAIAPKLTLIGVLIITAGNLLITLLR